MAISCPVSSQYGGCFIPFLFTYFIFYLFLTIRLISLQTLFFKLKYIPNKIKGRISASSSIRKRNASLKKSCDDILQALALFSWQIVVLHLVWLLSSFWKTFDYFRKEFLLFLRKWRTFLVIWWICFMYYAFFISSCASKHMFLQFIDINRPQYQVCHVTICSHEKKVIVSLMEDYTL